MRVMRFISLLALTTLVFACKPSGEETTSEQPATQSSPTAGGQQGAAPAGQLPPEYASLKSIEMEKMRDLYENCNSLDIVFYNTNFSLSQTEQAQIQTTLLYLLPSPVRHNMDCKPQGRISFWVQGELRREADIYVGENCNYYIWIEDGKPAYINPLSPDGINFYNKILTQGHELLQQQQGQ